MPDSGGGSVIRPRRTASHDTLANSSVFWIGLLAGVGVVSVLPTVIAVFRTPVIDPGRPRVSGPAARRTRHDLGRCWPSSSRHGSCRELHPRLRAAIRW